MTARLVRIGSISKINLKLLFVLAVTREERVEIKRLFLFLILVISFGCKDGQLAGSENSVPPISIEELDTAEESVEESDEDLGTDDLAQTEIVLKVRIYRYSFEAVPEFNSAFSRQELIEAIRTLNEIWSQANIRFQVEFVREVEISAQEFPEESKDLGRIEFKNLLASIAPEPHDEKVWSIVLIRKFSIRAGGVYLSDGVGTAVYTELNPQGMTYYNILAHELGHGLGLKHNDLPQNLMNSDVQEPSEATLLTQHQITRAREQALIGPF
jgi:hypothetical protein